MKKKIRNFFEISIVLAIMLSFAMSGVATITKTTLSEETLGFLNPSINPDAEFEWAPVDASGSHTIDGHEITLLETDQLVTLEIHVSGWDPYILMALEAIVDSAGYSNGVGGTLIPLGWPGSPEDGAFININDPDYVFSGLGGLPTVNTATLNYWWQSVVIGGGKADDGQTYYLGTLILDVPADASGTYTIQFSDGIMADKNGQDITPIILTSALITIAPANHPPNTPTKPSGPTSVTEGIQYTYTTITTDPDDDQIKYGFDFDNDGVIEPNHWTDFYPSGSTYTVKITFYGTGTRYLRAKAEDVHGAQSGFSPALTITVSGANNPPNTPSTPTGPSSGNVGVSYTYSTKTTDSDGDQVKYGWDWNGDGTVDEWSSLMNSGSTDFRSHTWTTASTYNVKVKAEDSHGAQSDFSSAKTVVISANNPPDKPTCEYDRASDELVVSATDPDGDQVRYGVSWDNDGNADEWTTYVPSGTEKRIYCEGRKGTVGVIAEDEYGAQSDWASQKSKNKAITPFPVFLSFLEQHPHLFPLLQKLLELK